MSSIYVPRYVYKRVQPHHCVDNGMIVRASNESAIRRRVNQTLNWQRKELFRYVGHVTNIPAGSGTRTRWRAKFHTGVGAKRLGVVFKMAQYRGGGSPYAKATFSGGSAVEATMHYGASNAGTGDGPATWGIGTRFIDIVADADYEVQFADADNGRLISACIFEIAKDPDTTAGYLLQNIGVHQPIYDSDREDTSGLVDNVWRRNGSHVFNWCTNVDANARVRSSATDANLIDTSITAVSSSSPGIKLDMRYKNRRSKTTVPCKFWAYGSTAGGGTGHVYLKDSGGTVLATVNINSGTDQWHAATATLDLPATEAKYDLHLDGDGSNNTTIYAVSCYEYET